MVRERGCVSSEFVGLCPAGPQNFPLCSSPSPLYHQCPVSPPFCIFFPPREVIHLEDSPFNLCVESLPGTRTHFSTFRIGRTKSFRAVAVGQWPRASSLLLAPALVIGLFASQKAGRRACVRKVHEKLHSRISHPLPLLCSHFEVWAFSVMARVWFLYTFFLSWYSSLDLGKAGGMGT